MTTISTLREALNKLAGAPGMATANQVLTDFAFQILTNSDRIEKRNEVSMFHAWKSDANGEVLFIDLGESIYGRAIASLHGQSSFVNYLFRPLVSEDKTTALFNELMKANKLEFQEVPELSLRMTTIMKEMAYLVETYGKKDEEV